MCEEVADSWRDVEEQRADLEVQLRETEQQLQNLSRRPAELEPKIAQSQLDKAQVGIFSGSILLMCCRFAMHHLSIIPFAE